MTTTTQHNDPSIYVFQEKEVQKSKWINNGTDTATFKLMTHEKRTGRDRPGYHNDGARCQGSLFLLVSVKPGETIELPSEYDQAIRTVSPKTGQVSGGLCPWLTKVGEEDIAVPDVFDYKSAIEEEQATHLIKQVKKENEMRNALQALNDKRKRVAEDLEVKKKLREETETKKSPGRPKKLEE